MTSTVSAQPYLVKDINVGPGSTSQSSGQFAAMNGLIFFTAYDGVLSELWRSDGTAAGTFAVTQSPMGGDTHPYGEHVVGSTLFFAGRGQDGSGGQGDELYRTDGTPGGTVLVKDINPGPASSDPSILTDVNGTLFLIA